MRSYADDVQNQPMLDVEVPLPLEQNDASAAVVGELPPMDFSSLEQLTGQIDQAVEQTEAIINQVEMAVPNEIIIDESQLLPAETDVLIDVDSSNSVENVQTIAPEQSEDQLLIPVTDPVIPTTPLNSPVEQIVVPEISDDIEPIELVTQVQASLECQQQEIVLPDIEPANLEMGDSSVIIYDAIPKIDPVPCWESGDATSQEQCKSDTADPILPQEIITSETAEATVPNEKFEVIDDKAVPSSPLLDQENVEACFEKVNVISQSIAEPNSDAKEITEVTTELIDIENADDTNDIASSLQRERVKSNVLTESLPALAESVPNGKQSVPNADDTIAKTVSEDSVFGKDLQSGDSAEKIDKAAKEDGAFADDEDEDTTAELIPPLPQDATEDNVEVETTSTFQDVMMKAASPSEVPYQVIDKVDLLSILCDESKGEVSLN